MLFCNVFYFLLNFVNVNWFIVCVLHTNINVVELWANIVMEMSVDVNPPIAEMPLIQRNVGTGEIPFLLSIPQLDLLKVILQSLGFKIVMVSDDQSLMAIQPRQEMHELFVISAKTQTYITQMVNLILRFHNLVPHLDHILIHKLGIFEGTPTVLDDVLVEEVSIRDKPQVLGH